MERPVDVGHGHPDLQGGFGAGDADELQRVAVGIGEELLWKLHRSRVERVAFDVGDAGLLGARKHVVEVGDDEGEESVPHGGVDAALFVWRRRVDAQELQQGGADGVADQRRGVPPGAAAGSASTLE